jgi:phthalate 4,5-dioxygenase reductase component
MRNDDPCQLSKAAMPLDATGPTAEAGDLMHVEVAAKEAIAADIWRYALRPCTGRALPPFTPGSHLTVVLPDGARRNYSLCSDPAEHDSWQIAVKREARGRGGSRQLVDQVHVGMRLEVSKPRNQFALDARAQRFLFIAGGIGITPIMSMMRHLVHDPVRSFRLIYCTRDIASTAFRDELLGEPFAPHVHLHHDGGDPERAFDLWPLLETPGTEHVYCCGPRGLMDAVADMSGHWPGGSVHFEHFGVDAAQRAQDRPFTVVLQRSGQRIEVAADQSILEALRGRGLRVSSSCESGTCGSCRTGLVAGDVEHRDMVLDEQERQGAIMVCVSRARSGELVLDR